MSARTPLLQLRGVGLDSAGQLDEYRIPLRVVRPAGTFYVFPDVRAICNHLQITSHLLKRFSLDAAGVEKGGEIQHQLGPLSIAEITLAQPSTTRLASDRKRETSSLENIPVSDGACHTP
jgi:hypothetical protein